MRLALWLLLAGLALAQPVTPGQPLPAAPNMVVESADMREARFLFAEGQRLHRQGQVDRSIELYRKALAKDPGRLEYRPYLAQALESEGQHQEALEQLDLYLAAEPASFGVTPFAGVTASQRVQLQRLYPLMGLARWEEVDQELALLEKPLEGHSDYHLARGLAELRRGGWEPARVALQRAVELDSQSEPARLNLASVHLQLQQSAAALEALQSLSSESAQVLRGLALYQQGQVKQAQELWRAQGSLDSALNLASSLARQNQTRQALLLVAALMDAHPESRVARRWMVHLYNRENRYEEGWATLQPLLPATTADLCELSGWTLLGLGRWQESLEALQQAYQKGGRGLSLEGNMALALGHLGRWKEALEHQQKVVAAQPQLAQAWLQLGWLYEHLALPSKAKEAYQRYLQIEPQGSQAAEVRERIKRL